MSKFKPKDKINEDYEAGRKDVFEETFKLLDGIIAGVETAVGEDNAYDSGYLEALVNFRAKLKELRRK